MYQVQPNNANANYVLPIDIAYRSSKEQVIVLTFPTMGPYQCCEL